MLKSMFFASANSSEFINNLTVKLNKKNKVYEKAIKLLIIV